MADENKTIALFSSDARKLYQGDVFRALALPKGYTLQFRYEKWYLHADILTKLNDQSHSLVNQPGCIFFVSGNDLAIEKPLRNLTYYSIRNVTIRGVFDDPTTEQVLFFLEMADFVDYVIPDNEDPNLLPKGGKFVSKINVSKGIKHSWINRIDAIKASFPDQLFFNINEVAKSQVAIVPTYSGQENASYFKVKDESTYQVRLSFYDLRNGTSKLNAKNLSDALTLYIPEDFSVNATRDTQTFTMSTASLSREDEVAFVRLVEKDSFDFYNVELKFRIERGSWKPWIFGALTAWAALGLLLAQLFGKKSSELDDLYTFEHVVIGLLVLISVFFSSVLLFRLFNKK